MKSYPTVERRYDRYDSAKKRVELLRGSRDTALFHKWIRICDRREQELDMTLKTLDGWVGRQNDLMKSVDSIRGILQKPH